MTNDAESHNIGSSPSRGTICGPPFQEQLPRPVQTQREIIMGFLPGGGILAPVQVMRRPMRTAICVLAGALLIIALPFRGEAKSYSSGGGHSYSSHSSSSGGSHSFSSGGSHSSSSGGSHSFSSGGGHSFSSGSSHSSSSGNSSGTHNASSGGSAGASHRTSASQESSSGNSGGK